MKTVGIIAEYNPFHNGHKYQIEQARKVTGADYVVVILSGNFVQRGEPAIIDKWARTKMALLGGADLVIELPVAYVLSSAEGFSHGSIALLNKTGIIDTLCFGSESGSIEDLLSIANIITQEPKEYKDRLRQALESGKSYPSAVASALPNFDFSPNNILAIEYLKALIKQKSLISPFTIRRRDSDYNQQELTETFSSATAIRKAILENRIDKIPDNIPSFLVLKEQIDAGRGPVSPEYFMNHIRLLVRRMPKEDLLEYPLVNEGIENRIYAVFNSDKSTSTSLDNIISKRYPATRIMRTLTCILLGITNKMMEEFTAKGPAYIRILGMRESASPLVRKLRNNADLPVSSRLIEFKKSSNKDVSNAAKLEALATNIYVTAFSTSNQKSGQDYKTNMIRL